MARIKVRQNSVGNKVSLFRDKATVAAMMADAQGSAQPTPVTRTPLFLRREVLALATFIVFAYVLLG